MECSSAEDVAQGCLRRCNKLNCYGVLTLDDEDGHYYCTVCSAQSEDFVEEASADEDIFGPPAAYKIFNQQLKSAEDPQHGLVKDLSLPMDFGRCPDAEEIRFRYVQGLQVMLQLQCDALVDKFGVNPLICGFAGTVWLRYVAASMLFDDGWADKAIVEQDEMKFMTRVYAKFRLERHNWIVIPKSQREDFDSKGKRARDGAPRNTSPDSRKLRDESQDISLYADKGKQTSKDARDTTARNAAVEKMKHHMEENGFQNLPLRAQRPTDGYHHYTRRRVDGKPVY